MGTLRDASPITRHAAGLVVLATLVTLVVVAVYWYVSRLPFEVPATGADLAVPAGASGPVRGPLPIPPGADRELLPYRDEAAGFAFQRLASWEARTPGPVEDEDGRSRTVVFEDPDSRARLAVTVWPGRGATPPARAWVEQQAPGMDSVDDHWPTEAVVAGVPAVIVWRDESPDAPARYAAFVRRGGDLVRIAYAASDGGALLGEFARALVTLEWEDGDTTDLVPPLPRPAGRYFPSASEAARTG